MPGPIRKAASRPSPGQRREILAAAERGLVNRTPSGLVMLRTTAANGHVRRCDAVVRFLVDEGLLWLDGNTYRPTAAGGEA